eukprot:g15491.t1
MSAYVLSWLNDELQLSNGPVNAIEREFASGYLFAEVIHKAHPKAFTVDDLAEFQNEKKVKGSTLASVKKHNAPLLKRALRVLSTKCGLSETKNTAVAEIMQEDRGTALRLLYQIRKSLEQQKLKSPIEKIPRLPKTELPADDVYWYGKGGHSEPLLKPFFDEERNQMVKILELEEQDETHILQNRDENRDYLLEKEVIRRQQMLDEDEFVLQFWRNTYRADVLKTTEEVRVERETRKYYRGQALFGIDGYERNLQRIGIDTSENAGTDVPTKGIANPMQLLESMKTRLPTRKNLFLECLANMRKIKASGRARRRGAIEREKRRRKQRVQTALEAQDLASTNALKEDTGRFLKSMAFHQKNARITYLQRLCAEKEVEWRTQTQEENAGRRRSESDARWQVSTEKVREEHAAREPERRDNKDTFHMMEKDRQAFRKNREDEDQRWDHIKWARASGHGWRGVGVLKPYHEKHREVRIDARERFFARANGSSGGGNGSTAAIPVDLDKPEFDGGEETNLPNETNQDKPPRTAHLQYPSMEDIEFVLLTGPPQSGKKSVANLLKSENVFVLDYEQTLRKAHDAWLEFKVEPGGESAPGLPKPLQILLQSDPHTEGVFEEMKAELIDALDLPPPKKGDPVPGEGVAKKHMEKLEAELEELEAAVELAKGELEEVVNKAAAEQNGGAGEGDAENDKDTTIEPPPVDPSEEIARAAIAEKIVCAEKAVYDWRLKSKKKPKCYVLFVGSYYPGTVDETASFMRECIFPTFHLESPCTTKATQELASLCLPQANDAANTALAKEKRACAVLIPEVAAKTRTRCTVFPLRRAVGRPFVDRVFSGKLDLQTSAKSPFAPIAPHHGGKEVVRHVKTAGKSAEEIASEIATQMLPTEVFPATASSSSSSSSREASANYDTYGQIALVYQQTSLNLLTDLDTEEKQFFKELEELKTQFEKFMNARNEDLKGPIREATRAAVGSENEAERLSELLWAEADKRRKIKGAKNVSSAQSLELLPYANQTPTATLIHILLVRSMKALEAWTRSKWLPACRSSLGLTIFCLSKKRAEEEFGKSYVQKASDWWSAKITALLLVMEKLLAAHWLFATELGDLVAQLVAGGGVDHKAFTKTEVSGARGTSSSSGSCSAVLGGSRQPGVEEVMQRKFSVPVVPVVVPRSSSFLWFST